jgi:hypothetical protein
MFWLCSLHGINSVMDWALAIERNSTALKGIVDTMFALLGLAARLPRGVHSHVLRLLRPTESALRRLIIIAARGLVVQAAPKRPKPAGPVSVRPVAGGRKLPASFQLFDTRKRFAVLQPAKATRVLPRIRVLGSVWGPDPTVAALWAAQRRVADPIPPPSPPPDGLVSAARLTRRLNALKSALDDLPRQALRLARWRARRANMPVAKFRSPLRPGPPPGHRRKKRHEIDEILEECHYFAWEALKPDTS